LVKESDELSRRTLSGRFGFSGLGSVFDKTGIFGGMMVVVFDDDEFEAPPIDGGGFDAGRGGALGISTTDGLLLLSRLSFDGCGDPKVLKDGLEGGVSFSR